MKDLDISNYLRNNFKPNKKSVNSRRLVYGFGVNDADYMTQVVIDGVRLRCKAYHAWSLMIERCYREQTLKSSPSYFDVVVCEEWRSFMSFRKWWVDNHVDGWQLDKDILVPGNKTYSPGTCIFVPCWVNSMIVDKAASRGSMAIGVSYERDRMKFVAHCQNPITKRQDRIGRFDDEMSAHNAYIDRKIKMIESVRCLLDAVDNRIFHSLIDIVSKRRMAAADKRVAEYLSKR